MSIRPFLPLPIPFYQPIKCCPRYFKFVTGLQSTDFLGLIAAKNPFPALGITNRRTSKLTPGIFCCLNSFLLAYAVQRLQIILSLLQNKQYFLQRLKKYRWNGQVREDMAQLKAEEEAVLATE